MTFQMSPAKIIGYVRISVNVKIVRFSSKRQSERFYFALVEHELDNVAVL